MQSINWIEMSVATWETLYMVAASGILAFIFGIPLGILLYTSHSNGLAPHKSLHRFLSILVNIFRAIPFVILLVMVVPITRLLVGTSIGSTASIVPLTFAAIPFVARLVENSLNELPVGLIEAGIAMGASLKQIIFKILLQESKPSIVRGATLTFITLVGYSAMAGAIGGGGLGQMAINYGYQRYNYSVTLVTVVLLVALVQLIQWCGDYFTRKLEH